MSAVDAKRRAQVAWGERARASERERVQHRGRREEGLRKRAVREASNARPAAERANVQVGGTTTAGSNRADCVVARVGHVDDALAVL